jgi:hypothetical protein
LENMNDVSEGMCSSIPLQLDIPVCLNLL